MDPAAPLLDAISVVSMFMLFVFVIPSRHKKTPLGKENRRGDGEKRCFLQALIGNSSGVESRPHTSPRRIDNSNGLCGM
jgi:hypothetical protein